MSGVHISRFASTSSSITSHNLHPSVVGIAGTAKNTGKTTALNALLEETTAARLSAAVTSIGYDGESVDTVTGLPKPRIILHEGTVATTSRTCLPSGGWEMLESTEFRTPLGELVIVRCTAEGPLVLAGPSKRSELDAVIMRMRAHVPDIVFIDGALNRLAPMACADALILATGAARTPDVTRLVEETAAIVELFALPAAIDSSEADRLLPSTPFPSAGDIAIARHSSDASVRRAFIDGLVSPAALSQFARIGRDVARITEIVLSDPATVLISGDPLAMAAALRQCRTAGMAATYRRTIPLIAVTVSPYVPEWDGRQYRPNELPAEALVDAMRSSLRVPVVDVVAEGARRLWELAFMRGGPVSNASR